VSQCDTPTSRQAGGGDRHVRYRRCRAMESYIQRLHCRAVARRIRLQTETDAHFNHHSVGYRYLMAGHPSRVSTQPTDPLSETCRLPATKIMILRQDDSRPSCARDCVTLYIPCGTDDIQTVGGRGRAYTVASRRSSL